MIGNFSFSVRLSFWVMLLQSQPRYGGGFQDLVRPPRSGRFQFSHGTSQAQRFGDQSTSGEKRVMRTNRTADPISHVSFSFCEFQGLVQFGHIPSWLLLGFGSVWTYPVLVLFFGFGPVWGSCQVWFQFGLCLSWRSCCVFPVSLLGASLLVLSWCGRTRK